MKQPTYIFFVCLRQHEVTVRDVGHHVGHPNPKARIRQIIRDDAVLESEVGI